MRIFGIRSVQLHTDTTQAWKNAGVSFFRRGSEISSIISRMLDNPDMVVLNLGKTSATFKMYENPELAGRIWNDGSDIRPLVWPGTSAELLTGLTPPKPESFPADIWIKAPGRAGRGKFHKQVDRPMSLPKEWDWQAHIIGQEYRVVTVGHKVVQNFERHGPNGNREYRWVRMADTPKRVKKLARVAARRVPGLNVIAWDIVSTEEEAYVFEGNTCPGVNVATANRVVEEIRKNVEAE